MKGIVRILLCYLSCLCGETQAFSVGLKSPSSPRSRSQARLASKQDEDTQQQQLTTNKNTDQENKFGFFQRIESVKCLVVGAVTGSLALAPFALMHDFWFNLEMIDINGLSQFEFDTDAAALQSGLFAIVYRYCIRKDNNPQLQDGVVGAFVITRTLSRIVVPPYCTAIPLYCGSPLGYLDWSLVGQLAVNGIESMAMFTATATAMNYCMERKIISKFE